MTLRPTYPQNNDPIAEMAESIIAGQETSEQTETRHQREMIRTIKEQRMSGIAMQATVLGTEAQKVWGRKFTKQYILSLLDEELDRLIRAGVPQE